MLVNSFDDDRLHYRRNRENIGMARNFKTAGAVARGRYLALLCDDDVWCPNFLVSLVPILDQDEEVSVAFADHYVMDAGGQILTEESDWMGSEFGRSCLREGKHQPFLDLIVASSLVRTQEVGRVPPSPGGRNQVWRTVEDGSVFWR